MQPFAKLIDALSTCAVLIVHSDFCTSSYVCILTASKFHYSFAVDPTIKMTFNYRECRESLPALCKVIFSLKINQARLFCQGTNWNTGAVDFDILNSKRSIKYCE